MTFDTNQQSLLTFRIGPVLCCAPSLPVRSIITPPKLTHPPGSDQGQPGIFRHGSHIVKVIDLRQKFGIDKEEQTHPGNLIITLFDDESFAFWVDQILDVFDFPKEGWGNLPAAIPRGIFSRTLLLDKKIHLYSEFEKLATIKDLGYLRHYIQQLKEEEKKKDIIESKDKTTKSSSTTVSKKEVTTSTLTTNKILKQDISKSETDNSEASLPSDNATSDIKTESLFSNKETSHITQNKKTVTNSLVTTTSTAPYTSKSVQPVKQTTSTQKTNNIDNEPHKLQTKLDSNASEKNIIQNKIGLSKNRTNIPTSSEITNNKQPSGSVRQKEERIAKSISLTSDTQYINNEESSYAGVIIFFFILFSAIGAGLYYFLSEKPTSHSRYKINTPGKVRTMVHEDKPNYQDALPTPLLQYESEKMLLIDSTDLTSKNINEADDIEKNILPSENIETDNSTYRAEITTQDDEITITIHEPAITDTEIKSEPQAEAEINIAPQEIVNNMPSEAIIESPIIETLEADELSETIPAKKIVKEVIHIVVKGDTLWAIAKKYVNNPFLYPDLARLSNIKNPHRIYPGNRVRIRFIKN